MSNQKHRPIQVVPACFAPRHTTPPYKQKLEEKLHREGIDSTIGALHSSSYTTMSHLVTLIMTTCIIYIWKSLESQNSKIPAATSVHFSDLCETKAQTWRDEVALKWMKTTFWLCFRIQRVASSVHFNYSINNNAEHHHTVGLPCKHFAHANHLRILRQFFVIYRWVSVSSHSCRVCQSMLAQYSAPKRMKKYLSFIRYDVGVAWHSVLNCVKFIIVVVRRSRGTVCQTTFQKDKWLEEKMVYYYFSLSTCIN